MNYLGGWVLSIAVHLASLSDAAEALKLDVTYIFLSQELSG
jgi:hypothetical protein